jgi:MarR family transcriptional regulator, lower aerobic nicotinate degradation pathway regulator
VRAQPSWLLAQSAAQVGRAITDALDKAAGTRSQYAALAALEEHGSLSQTGLSEHTGTDPSDIVRLVDQLAAAKLVVRAPDPQDRRRNTVTVTKAGRHRLVELDAVVDSAQAEGMAHLDSADREELARLLTRALGLTPEGDR